MELLIAQSLTFSQLLGLLSYTSGMEEAARESCKPVDGGLTRVFVLLGKRWTGLIVAVLMERPVHFSDLCRAIPGISERMLSDRLSELGAAGLVVREVDAGPPLRVAYRLTEAGVALGRPWPSCRSGRGAICRRRSTADAPARRPAHRRGEPGPPAGVFGRGVVAKWRRPPAGRTGLSPDDLGGSAAPTAVVSPGELG